MKTGSYLVNNPAILAISGTSCGQIFVAGSKFQIWWAEQDRKL